jgi:hypothetical protein
VLIAPLWGVPFNGFRRYSLMLSPDNTSHFSYPDFVTASPRGLVPALSHKGATVCDSMVVLEFLEDAFPQRFVPRSESLIPELRIHRSMATSPPSTNHYLLFPPLPVSNNPLRAKSIPHIAKFRPLLPPGDAAARARVRYWSAFANERIIPHYYKMLMVRPDNPCATCFRNKKKAVFSCAPLAQREDLATTAVKPDTATPEYCGTDIPFPYAPVGPPNIISGSALDRPDALLLTALILNPRPSVAGGPTAR